MTPSIGPVGIWTLSHTWAVDDRREAVAELDELGFGALWLGVADPDLRLAQELLAATRRIVIATGIVNVWAAEAADLAARHHRLATAYPGRFLLGLGASHAPEVAALGKAYRRPLAHLAGYLDALDAAPRPVPAADRVLAALGPKALALAATRSAGAVPYLVTPEYTATARERLGTGPLLAVEQKVVLSQDPDVARRTARAHLAYYLDRPNYLRNLGALGFTADDLAGAGSDRLVDALYAWGSPERVAKRIAAHRDAGADHVGVQVVTLPGDAPGRAGHPDRAAWRTLAAALLP